MASSIDYVRDLATRFLVPVGLKLIVALFIFFLGRWLARGLIFGLGRLMERSKVDVSLRKFLSDVLYAVMLVAVITVALDTLGIQTTAVIAVLGAAGLAVGLALQGSLSNFAAGVMLIILRPYKVDDTVGIGKYVGRVDAIKVFHTVLITGDNREVTIPNGQIIGQPIENMTTLGSRRVDLVVTVAHGSDLRVVKARLEEVVRADPRIQATPAATVELAEVTDAGVRLYLRPWTAVATYQAVATAAVAQIKEALDAGPDKFTVALASPV